MKIATYNIWNSDYLFDGRLKNICDEINHVKPDIINLQEVRYKSKIDSSIIINKIVEETDYQFFYFEKYHNENEGLAVLSRRPLTEMEVNWDRKDVDNCNAMMVQIEVDGKKLLVGNLHLDYSSVLNREKQIVEIVTWMSEKKADYYFLCGDFNSDETSSVYRYLTNRQSLNGSEANWIDFSEVYGKQTGKTPTLDFWGNPRWVNINVLEVPKRCDWILMKPFDDRNLNKVILNHLEVFGNDSNTFASDHYGICVDIEFE
ncbi:endonuclease/exonuclease/phosphatase family protein [Paenibacillus faecalis]|uniref:endonuclease/exonuclease/phosphatase family protein n=1 Tax=Paenibacillus faecalis TaxID=2079532 RepID=UPI00131A4E1E|nr:endonuclease/exonuclease/phosphatase family protein [Paenibacillus faecalis]